MAGPERALRAGRALVALGLALAAGLALAQSPAEARLQACMACHGPQGQSQIPGTPSLAGQPRIFIENQLVLIREGLRDVPQMKGLLDGMPDAEIRTLAQFFAGQKAAPLPGAVDPGKVQRGQALSARLLCGSCHLPDFSGREQVPRLAGQQEAFLLQSMKEFRDRPGPGRDTIMAATLRGLSDADLADLAHFTAHFGK
jgi:cytochrome c553